MIIATGEGGELAVYCNDLQKGFRPFESPALNHPAGRDQTTDLDGDGFPELILACEWGPVRVFKNQTGKLREATEDFGLSAFTGWWTG